ncbi:nucleotidyltransferase domain-containing protein [Vibrio vulnificus]
MKEKYAPHTIILYGSYARNEATETSDIPVQLEDAGFNI